MLDKVNVLIISFSEWYYDPENMTKREDEKNFRLFISFSRFLDYLIFMMCAKSFFDNLLTN